MPRYFHHLSGFVRAQHNFWDVLEKKKLFMKVFDTIILHCSLGKIQVPCFRTNLYPACRSFTTSHSKLSAEIGKASKRTDAANPVDCFRTPIFACQPE